MLLYIIILWIIVFQLDHHRITQPHNCNIECILYAPSNLFYSAISKIPCEPVYHPKYIFHFLPELQIHTRYGESSIYGGGLKKKDLKYNKQGKHCNVYVWT